MCSIESNHIWNLGTWNPPFSVISNLRPILLIFWLPKNDYSHKSAIFSWKKPKWSKKDENMYKVYRKYKKNGFQNTLKMAKMCSLRGTVPPFRTMSKKNQFPSFDCSPKGFNLDGDKNDSEEWEVWKRVKEWRDFGHFNWNCNYERRFVFFFFTLIQKKSTVQHRYSTLPSTR